MNPKEAVVLVEKLRAHLNKRTKVLKELLQKDAELKALDEKIFELIIEKSDEAA